MNNKRYYSFILVIYEDDEKFGEQFYELSQIQDSIFIRHDQDIDEEGNLKKPHYHFVLKLKNACTISALSKKVYVEENMIEPVKKSFNGSLKYLIHYGSDDKFQYNTEDVKSDSDKLLRRFKDLVTKEVPEVDKVITIQEFVESYPDYIKISVLSKYVQKLNMWDAFRRNYSFIKDLVNEHNGQISAERYHDTSYQRVNEDFYKND